MVVRGREKIRMRAILSSFFASFKSPPLPQRNVNVMEGEGI